MINRKILLGCLILLFACLSAAQTIKEVPIKNVDPASGEKMYVAYCAACHGVDGKGSGPAATALKQPLPDLTQLAKKNGGNFSGVDVYEIILGYGAMPAAHGSKDMPVWGPMFSSMCGGSTKNEVSMRASNLTSYLKTLQQ